VVTDNIVVDTHGQIGGISPKPYQYSTIENNAAYGVMKLNAVFNNPFGGDYSLRVDSIALGQMSAFEPLPVSSMGRY